MNTTMKITVITDKAGRIVSTAGHSAGDAGSGGPLAGPGETATDLELTGALADIQSPDELHRALEKQMQSGKKS